MTAASLTSLAFSASKWASAAATCSFTCACASAIVRLWASISCARASSAAMAAALASAVFSSHCLILFDLVAPNRCGCGETGEGWSSEIAKP